MRWTVVASPLTALSLVAWLTPQALAQDTKTAGTVTAMAADSISVTSGGKNMTFTVDTSTDVIVRGASTASRAAYAERASRLWHEDLVKVGDSVEVTYHEKSGAPYAAVIRRVAGAVRSAASDDNTANSNGTVEAVSGTSLTISGSTAGGGTFKQTFTIDRSTKVIAVGAGTAAAARGGKIAVTDIVARGDRVNVSYHPVGNSLHAAEIRVTGKAIK